MEGNHMRYRQTTRQNFDSGGYCLPAKPVSCHWSGKRWPRFGDIRPIVSAAIGCLISLAIICTVGCITIERIHDEDTGTEKTAVTVENLRPKPPRPTATETDRVESTYATPAKPVEPIDAPPVGEPSPFYKQIGSSD